MFVIFALSLQSREAILELWMIYVPIFGANGKKMKLRFEY